jgi:tRNA-specific 2-thiouridylase
VKKASAKKLKVFVGMSGGVDSSVSAALLKEAGFDVTGVFIKVWQPDWISCTWKDDRLDAMRVAAHLGIPFLTLDLEKEYKREVVDYMVREYKMGRTPNPDVMCNRHVKFGAFFKKARDLGADFVATGHYAKIDKGVLVAADDKNKDQSYFLWTLTDKELKHTLFPVGGLEKSEVRKLAKKFRLVNADKKDSQGLCFIGKIDMKDFLKEYIPVKKGNVINLKGELVGTHDGALFYTLGERHGFILTKKTPEDKPYFVVAKDIKKNTITVSNKNEKGELPLSHRAVSIDSVQWTEMPKASKKYSARIRYRQPLQTCTVKKGTNNTWSVFFDRPQSSVSPGQSLVLYDRSRCLGGGIIA